MGEEPVKSNQICFFLGAGASVEAGVPDTYGLVREFRKEFSSNKPLSNTIDVIITILQKWRKAQRADQNIDVELLLETLEKLAKPDQEALLQFYKISDFALSGYQEKRPIIELLRDFIKSKAMVNRVEINYLAPLLEFIEQFGSMDIFSVNYDTAIEQFASVYRKTYSDGFDSQWNPNSFNKERTDIRLYKLHGSVTWYRTDDGEYVKVPVRVPTDTLRLITDEEASSLILYPMRKWQYTEPLLELLVMLKKGLEGSACCVVVGYSFRDEHITRIFWDAARNNPSLHLILIGPRSEKVYEEKIKLYRETAAGLFAIPSSLSTRVVCHGVTKGRLLGGPDWIPQLNQSIRAFVDAEHLEKVEEMCSVMEWNDLPLRWGERLDVSYKMWFHNVWRGHAQEDIQNWVRRLADALEVFGEKGLDIWLGQIPQVMLRFKMDSTIKNPSDVSVDVARVSAWATEKLGMLGPINDKEKQDAVALLSRSSEGLGGLLVYLRPWIRDSMVIEEYVKSRSSAKEKIEQIQAEYDSIRSKGFTEGLKAAPVLIQEIESSLIQPIIAGLRKEILTYPT